MDSIVSAGRSRLVLTASAAAVLALAGCSNMQMGSQEAKTVATGSAGGANAQNANKALEKCPTPLGTIAVVEDQSASWYGILTGQLRLGSTAPVLKLLVQQSNCFMVVERGRAMNNMMQERALQESGELRQQSNFGKGQMVSADYAMSPSITFSQNDAGGLGTSLGYLGGWAGVIGGVAGSLRFKEASTMLTLVDNRSGVQVAAAEGSARNMDFGAMGSIFTGGLSGGGGGYANTAEGKVIVAAFTDSYNNLVRAARSYQPQVIQGGPGTGGALGVQGSQPPSQPAPAAAPTSSGKKRKASQ
jgi:hypothetical protein